MQLLSISLDGHYIDRLIHEVLVKGYQFAFFLYSPRAGLPVRHPHNRVCNSLMAVSFPRLFDCCPASSGRFFLKFALFCFS